MILAIAAVIFVLNLEGTLISLGLILQIVFFLAIAVVLYMFWRDRMRHEIETWSERSSRVFYGSALLIVGISSHRILGVSAVTARLTACCRRRLCPE